MPVTEAELNYARSYIGLKETESVFNERVDRLQLQHTERNDAIDAAIEESLRAQLATMTLDRPGSASVGSVSYSQQANIQEAQKMLEEFRTGLSTGGLQTGHLVRPRTR